MRRLLQLGTLFLILVTFLAPLAECFDSWDAPGLTNDTEFAVFFLILTLCLVLLVSKLVSALAQLCNLASIPHLQSPAQFILLNASRTLEIFIPPRSAPPLRI